MILCHQLWFERLTWCSFRSSALGIEFAGIVYALAELTKANCGFVELPASMTVGVMSMIAAELCPLETWIPPMMGTVNCEPAVARCDVSGVVLALDR